MLYCHGIIDFHVIKCLTFIIIILKVMLKIINTQLYDNIRKIHQ